MAIELMDVVDEKEIRELPPSAVSDICIPLERWAGGMGASEGAMGSRDEEAMEGWSERLGARCVASEQARQQRSE